MWPIVELICGLMCLAIASTVAAYRNGVNDGYGYAREPRNPGYRRAGEILRKRSAHRWPELAREPETSSERAKDPGEG